MSLVSLLLCLYNNFSDICVSEREDKNNTVIQKYPVQTDTQPRGGNSTLINITDLKSLLNILVWKEKTETCRTKPTDVVINEEI